MSFTKLDSGIINSSMWSEPIATRVLWVTMLAMCDENGMVKSSISGLIRASNIPKEEFDIAIAAIEGPDWESRTPAYDGRRAEKVDGGWIILNYLRYREREDKDLHREYMRNWRKSKDKKITVNNCESQKITVESPSASASASASASTSARGSAEGDKEIEVIPPTVEQVNRYCEERKNGIDAQSFCDHYETRNWIPKGSNKKMKSWKAAVRTWENYQKKNLGQGSSSNFNGQKKTYRERKAEQECQEPDYPIPLILFPGDPGYRPG